MSETIVIICDRCGESIQKSTRWHVTFTDNVKHDLCYSCASKLNSWMQEPAVERMRLERLNDR